MTRLHLIKPLLRFHLSDRGRRFQDNRALRFNGRNRFYHCPNCRRKTLIRGNDLDGFNPPPSPFSSSVQAAFALASDSHTSHACHDFHCRGCQRPVRLLYDMQERQMGGYFYPLVRLVLEME